ncbi:tyrosine transaminase family protein [Actinidia rufa]|uniref:Tyrosine transaminase family protein n=1 Tax=Actinidia rufa TaxID=165716 RepID=A0A7J0DGW4_9ERIC|nr:tyrosine transaminase family protein [Actinidia rufa]
MENGTAAEKWQFRGNEVLKTASAITIRGVLNEVMDNIEESGPRPIIPLGHGDPSAFPCFRTVQIAEEAIVDAARSAQFNGYASTVGIPPARRIVDCIKGFLNISSDPATFIQGALPQILGKTGDDFFSKIVNILREAADICYDRIKEIPCITCPSKPEGSMFVMVKLNLSLLEDIKDDIDFCAKLAKEESVVVLPAEISKGVVVWAIGVDQHAFVDLTLEK